MGINVFKVTAIIRKIRLRFAEYIRYGLLPNHTQGEMDVESKGFKLQGIASGLCMATVVVISFFTGQLHASGGVVQPQGDLSHVYKHIQEEVTPLDLNDPVPDDFKSV